MAVGHPELVGLSAPGQRELGKALARQCEPLPWGPVELEIAMRIGRPGFVSAWKPVIDSLVPLLGRRPGKSEFDIEDGRIVSLALHRDVDPTLGHRVELRVWWRMAEGGSSGPSLEYHVGDTSRAPASRPRAASASTCDPRVIDTLARFRELQSRRDGFVVITDTASAPRLHRAGCSAVKEPNFVRKVIDNGMRNGKYHHVASEALARDRWPRLTAHHCASGAGR